MSKNDVGSTFTRFFRPIVQALREMGGSGTTAEVIDRSIEILRIPQEEQGILLESGTPRVRNQAQWARLILVRGGLIDSSTRGLWRLTDQGLNLDPERFDFEALWRQVERQLRAEHLERRKARLAKEKQTEDLAEFEEDESVNYHEQLLTLLRELPANGFERLCQRLLRESGFEQVEVTGRSGDGGIDGIGILRLNAFVSFKVLFQCKRYEGSVSPSQVRDFRGAMMGRADKGILLTTGSFTVEAKKEARRDGATPIELVDGDALVLLFEKLRLGLTPRETFDVDPKFFDEFR